MNWKRLVYKTHKWLAVTVGLFVFLWFASGIVMVLPQSLLERARGSTRSAPHRELSPSFREIRVTLPDAIASLERAVGRPIEVKSVRFRRLGAQLVYEIATFQAGTHLVDAMDGKRVVLSEELAREIAGQLVDNQPPVREVALLTRHDRDYATGALPVYRVAFQNAEASIVYVGAETGEAYATDRRGRLRAFVVGTHTLDFLRPLFQGRWVRFLLLVFSGFGLLMSVFGSWILLLQFGTWWRARRGAA